jgi:hypothetical protein
LTIHERKVWHKMGDMSDLLDNEPSTVDDAYPSYATLHKRIAKLEQELASAKKRELTAKILFDAFWSASGLDHQCNREPGDVIRKSVMNGLDAVVITVNRYPAA